MIISQIEINEPGIAPVHLRAKEHHRLATHLSANELVAEPSFSAAT